VLPLEASLLRSCLDVWKETQYQIQEASSQAFEDRYLGLSAQQVAHLAWPLVLKLALVQERVGLRQEAGSQVLVARPSSVLASYREQASSQVELQLWAQEQPLVSTWP
jgi:hypothetical protein